MNIDSLLTKIERVEVSTISLYPDNPRKGNIEEIARSLASNSQFQPLIVQESTRYILAGNHTYIAATEVLGWDHIDIVLLDVTDDEALKIVLAANRTADLGTYDDMLLAAILGEIREENEDLLEGTGYGSDDVDTLLADALLFNPEEDEADPEAVARATAVLERLFPSAPMTLEEELANSTKNAEALLSESGQGETEPKTGFRRTVEAHSDIPQPSEFIIFRLGELRAKIPRETGEQFIKELIKEHSGNSNAAGRSAALMLGFEDAEVQEAVVEGTERWM